MKHVAFKMQLHPGFEAEYKKRHDEIWPELKALLKDSGIHNYHIYLDEPTGALFATMEIAEQNTSDENKNHPVMKMWWDYMSDIMESNPDKSPVAKPLREVFYLP
jgi:L-rhamnose mutarotase